MPVLIGSAYSNLESVLARARVIINDSAIAGGDILTDSYAGVLPLCDIAYEAVQVKLSNAGVDVFINYAWLIGLPAVTTLDPEARLIITDTGYNIIYPSGVGDSSGNSPLLPPDMVVPSQLSERQSGTSNFAVPMVEPNNGIRNYVQQSFLIDWEYGSYQGDDCLMFRGALQVQDVKLKYEKKLPLFGAVTDPLPIRGVDNAAAYEIAAVFAEARGGSVAGKFALRADEEIYQLSLKSVRKSQRQHSRRRPFSSRSSGVGWPAR